jgi:uracil-DNA glycosylase family 4
MPSLNAGCTACDLHTSARTVCVAGQGPSNASIMIVGEAPGRNEDAYGYPFIGRAGELLDNLLMETGFRREDCFVTNVIKCRPTDSEGKDRAPNAREIKACRQYIIGELQAVQPRYVIPLGNIALKALTGVTGISKHRGVLLDLHGVVGESDARVFPTIHPAAALRYPHFGNQIRDDLKLLRRTIDGNFVEVNVPWRESSSLTIDMGWFVLEPWSFDLETNGVKTRDAFAHIYLCAIDNGATDVGVYENIDAAVDRLVRTRARKVGHNSSAFDRLWIQKCVGANIKCDDTMLMAWLLHEEWGGAQVRKLNLEALAVSELGARPWKKDVTWDWSDPRSIPWDEAKAYCARDTRYTRLLALDMMPKLQADGQLWTFYDKLMLPASRAIADMEERGLLINNHHVAEAKAHYITKAAEHLDALRSIGAQYGLDNLNPGSTKQIADLLFDKMGYDVLDKTPKGALSTAVGVIKTLRENHDNPLFDHLLQYRKCRNKMLGTYLAHYEDEQDYFGRWFPWTSLVQTATGRTSGNAQQLPRPENGPMIRRCVGAPEGALVMEVDFSQLEMRVAASRYVFDEPNLRAAFERGDDVHRLLAAEIHGKHPDAVTDAERSNAKPPNFMFLFGGEENMYIRTLLEDQDIVKSYEQAKHERDSFFRRWSHLQAGHERVVRTLEHDGQVRTLFGTLRRLPDVHSEERKVKVEAYRQAVNAVVQAPACHFGLIGLVILGAAGFEVRSFQHDAYLLWVEDSERAVRAAAAKIRYLLERGVPEVMASEFGIDWDVPLKVDIKVGTAWTENDRSSWLT